MRLTVEFEQEDDGRWIAEVRELPGVLVYAQTQPDALRKVKALALRVLADRIERNEKEEAQVLSSFDFARAVG